MTPMNKILASACPSNVVERGDSTKRNVGQVSVYWIETHCVGWWVTAKLVGVEQVAGETDKFEYHYEILEMRAEDN